MKQPSKILFVTLAVILLAVGVYQQQQETAEIPEVIKSPNDQRDYSTITLDNGLEVVLVSDPTVDKSAAALSVGVGLLKDPMSQQGMAHYLEHMLFLGTEKYPESSGFSDFMSQHGGSNNAYTWLEITNYMFEIKNDAYVEALDRFADFFIAPKLYPEYTDKERNAVNAEWSMRREMDFFGQFKLNRSMMGAHPANRFLIGNLETLGDKEGSLLHPQTVAFFEQYYSANIMKLAMVSDRPLSEMEQLARQYFAAIPNKAVDKPVVNQALDFDTLGGKRIHYVPNEDVKELVIDFTIKNNIDQYRSKPNTFVTYLLGNEMPGSPAYELKRRGLISDLVTSESPDQYGNYGTLSVTIELTDAGMQAREAITAVVMRYIDLLREQGVDKKYFSEIKTSLENRFRFLEKGNAFNYVSNLAAQLQTYPAAEVISAPYTFERFDAEAVNAVLAQLNPETLRIWYISQQEPSDQTMHFYQGQYQITDIAAEEIASWRQPGEIALTLPKVNTLLPQSFDIKTKQLAKQEKPEVVYQQDGISVWQYPSQAFADQPKGVLRVYFNSPARQAGINGQILLSLWTDLFAIQQSALATEASIAGMGMGLIDRNGLELRVSGFTDKQPLLLQRALKAMQIQVEPESFKHAVDRYVRNLSNQQKQFPIRQLMGNLGKVTNSASYSNESLIAAAQALTADDLSRFIQQVKSNNHIRIFAFGNYDQQDIEYFVSEIKTVLPAERSETEFTRGKAWLPQSGETLARKIDLPVADVGLLDLMVHPDPSLTQLARAQLLNNHMRNKTFDKLRTEEQLAYAVTSLNTRIKDYTALGLAIQTPVKDVGAMQQRFDDFKQEYAQQLDAIGEQEFAQLKNSLLVELREKPKNLSEEQAPMLSDWYREKWTFDTRARLIAEVEQLTLDDIKTFYRETALNPDAARVSVQLRGTKFKDQPFATIKGEKEITSLREFHQRANYQQ